MLDGEVCRLDEGLATDDGRLAGILVGEHDPTGALIYRGFIEHGFRRAPVIELLERARPLRPFVHVESADNLLWLEPEIEPEIVAEVTYGELMQGRLRDPVFRGIGAPAARI
jgi:ATP-dependent DNA ligase